MKADKPLLVIITGPTASGKTSLSIELATTFSTAVISADSRQIYRGMGIGTAAPDEEQQRKVRHYLTSHLDLTEEYNAFRFEQDALKILEEIFQTQRIAIVCGGSGLYVKALCEGIDLLPDADEDLRQQLRELWKERGIEALRLMLHELDPQYYLQVDLNNPVRLIRAIEVCKITGKRFSELRKGNTAERPFRIFKAALKLSREELNRRIDLRTEAMMRAGWLEEAEKLIPFKQLNSLNTLGYKEIFQYFDGEITLEEAVEKIKINTRRYAKRQMTWFAADKEIRWYEPDAIQDIVMDIRKTME